MTDDEWQEFYRKLFFIAYNYFNIPALDAEDIAQDIICQHLTHKNINRYPKGYWKVVVKNRIITQARRHKSWQSPRVQQAMMGISPSIPNDLAITDPTELICRLQEVLREPEAREILRIFNKEKKKRGKMSNTVRARLYKLRRKLRDKLGSAIP